MRASIILLVAGTVSSCAMAQTFTLKSNDIGGQTTNEQVFNGFGCTGKNVSPELNWANAPEGTKSFAITIYDKDAPTGSGWYSISQLVPNTLKEVREMRAKTCSQQGQYKV